VIVTVTAASTVTNSVLAIHNASGASCQTLM
jgi:hypothetical protein